MNKESNGQKQPSLEELFLGYKRKGTPDTYRDYLKGRDPMVEILDDLGESGFDRLKSLILLFEKYQKAAKRVPGEYKPGHPGLGANIRQYTPSLEEIICSELGKLLLKLIEDTSIDQLKKLKEDLLDSISTNSEALQTMLDDLRVDKWDIQESEFPELPDGDKNSLCTMSFSVTADQRGTITEALKKAKETPFPDTGNENSSGNALWRVCEAYR